MIKRIISLFFLNSVLLFSVEKEILNFEKVLNSIEEDNQSYEYKNFINAQKNTEIRIKDSKLGDFNGITISSSYDMSENLFDNRDRKYNKTFQNKLTYGNFFVNYNFVESDNSYLSYGFEKDLKEIFYSKYKSDLRINYQTLNLNQISYQKSIQNKKIELVNLYQNILNIKDEINFRKKSYEHYRVELEKFKKSYSLGTSPKINVESIELEADEALVRINILEEKLKNLYKIGKNEYSINFEAYELSHFLDYASLFEKSLENYTQTEIEEIKVKLQISKEKLNYSKYDKLVPNIYLGYERVDKNLRNDRYYRNQDIAFVRFSKKLFSTNSEYEINKIEVENLENDLKEKLKQIKNEKLKLKSEYIELKKLALISDKKLDIYLKKYKIKEKEYELNKASYLDVIDEYNKYLAQEIETKKSKNDLNAFIYKIIIKN